MSSIMDGNLPTFPEPDEPVGKQLQAVFNRCLQKDAKARPTMDEVFALLHQEIEKKVEVQEPGWFDNITETCACM